jgi:hypothetical protein
MIRIDLVHQLFADLVKSLTLPENWREIIRKQMLAEAQAAGQTEEATEREKERLKRVRILKQHREGYIDDDEFAGEMAAVELALRQLDVPANCITKDLTLTRRCIRSKVPRGTVPLQSGGSRSEVM